MKNSMTKKALVLLGTGGGIALTVAAASHFRGRGKVAAGDSESTAVAAKTAGDEQKLARSCSLNAGTALSYSLRIATEGGLAEADQNAPGQAKKLETTATLDLEALPAEHGNVLLGRLRGLDPETSAVTGSLDAPFLLAVDDSCAISGFARLATIGVPTARTQQALAHELQWAMPAGRAAEAPGENSLGAFTARYASGRDGSGSFVTRSIARYTRLWNPRAVKPGSQNLVPSASHRRIGLDDKPWFASIEGIESSHDLSLIDATSTTMVKRATPLAGALADAPRDQKSYIWEDLLPKQLPAPAVAVSESLTPVDRQALKQTSLKAALRSLETKVERGANIKDTWPAMSQLLEVRPDLAKPLADKLVSGEIPAGATASVFIALGNAKVPEARDALLGINRNPARHMMDRSRAAFALVSRDDVGIDLARDLSQDSRAITTGATRPERIYAREAGLALGMMAGLKGDAQPDIKKEAVGAIHAALGAGKTWYDLRPAFAMIANLGDSQMLSITEPYTRSPDAKVRQASTVAIRRMRPADSEAFTVGWLGRETDPDVKRHLYTTLQRQIFDAHEVASDAVVARAIADLKSEPPQQMLTRQAILRSLKDVVAADPKKMEGPLRQVLRDQMTFELREQSGLADLIGPLLSADDLALSARTVADGLARDHGPGTTPGLPTRGALEAE